MTPGDTGRLIYLVVLALAVIGWFIAESRGKPGKALQQAAVWGLIFVGVIAAIGLWSDIRRTTLRPAEVSAERIEIPRAADGHFYLDMKINGAPITFMIDTGASNIVLSRTDAARAGIDIAALRYLGEAETANGIVRTALIRLDRIAVGPIIDTSVRAYVNDGQMGGSLLGMDYINRFSAMTIRADMMVLER